MIVLLCILLCSSFEFTGHVTPLSLLQKNVWPCVRKRGSEEDGQEDNNWEEGRTHMDHIVSEIHMVIRGVHVAWLTSLPVLDTWTLPFWKNCLLTDFKTKKSTQLCFQSQKFIWEADGATCGVLEPAPQSLFSSSRPGNKDKIISVKDAMIASQQNV